MAERRDHTSDDRWRELVDRLIDETIAEAELAELSDRLLIDAEARAYYLRRVALHTALVWEAVPIAHELDRQKFAAGRDGGTFAPRWSLGMRLAAALAILVGVGALVLAMMTGGAQLAPDDVASSDPASTPAPVPVAVLSDASQARWRGGEDAGPGVGADVATGAMALESGRVQFLLASGAVVDVYGPAEFDLTGENACTLERGRLVAWVPEQAHGFAVTAPGLTVVDLGTQFGIEAGGAAIGSEVHVFRGSVEANVVNDRGKVVRQSRLAAGQAVRVERRPTGMAMSSVAVDTQRFLGVEPARETFDLITATRRGVIDADPSDTPPVDIRPDQPFGVSLFDGTLTTGHIEAINSNANFYVTVPDNRFIDGVFIPDGVADDPVPVQVAGSGLVVRGLPDTNGQSWDHVWLGPNITVLELPAGLSVTKPQRRVLGMHSNKGVTFDLDAVRRDRPGFHIDRFKADIGNARGSVEFFVLVDGQVRYRSGIHAGAAKTLPVNVPIAPDARYLTLIVTDGGDGLGHDWAVFIDPTLDLLGN